MSEIFVKTKLYMYIWIVVEMLFFMPELTVDTWFGSRA